LGLFVVSVSILKGVIVKSELPDALALVMIKTVLAILGLIIIANLTAKKPTRVTAHGRPFCAHKTR